MMSSYCGAVDANGKLIAWHHLVVSDRVLAFMDPVRWKTMKGRDNIAMRGTELPTYEVASLRDVVRDIGRMSRSLHSGRRGRAHVARRRP